MQDPKTKQEDVFSTRDIYLAATLVTLRFEMLNIDYQVEGLKPRPIGYFNFTETPLLRDARSKYNQGLVQVEPRMFMNNLQSLKSEVVNMFQNPNSKANKDTE